MDFHDEMSAAGRAFPICAIIISITDISYLVYVRCMTKVWVIHAFTFHTCSQIIHDFITLYTRTALQWRHNDHDGVSNYQYHGCLLNRVFRCRWKKTSKLRVTGLCAGTSPGAVNSPHKLPVTRKMFPFDDVIMETGRMYVIRSEFTCILHSISIWLSAKCVTYLWRLLWKMCLST